MIDKLEILNAYLSSETFFQFASDPLVIIGIIILFVLAVIFRWKWVLVTLLFCGGSLAIIRYTNFKPVDGSVDPTLVSFVVGFVVITVAIIYLVFIRSD
ncbi:MAG: hypothetical protein GTN70_03310 [Deltaproteobacteria bacterium]|nr:hypothetical protein [Deltaproteobacteria bacterium]NIS76675.1 hypothetical protein [Deltaproteobacteria bacterium]